MATSSTAPRPGSAALGHAGLASVAAGLIHVGIGIGHRSDAAVLALSVATGLVQIGWGWWALVRRTRVVAALGAAVSVSALVGWALAKLTGIALIDGLAAPEPVGLADGVGAVLAFVALILSFRALQLGFAPGGSPTGADRRAPMPALAVVVVVAGLVVAAVAAADEQPDDRVAVAIGSPSLAASVDTRAENRRFDPAEPVDLSGVPGVTAQEQQRAEDLLVATLDELGRFADHEVALEAGYQSLGDAFTGHEHLVDWDLLDDGRELDPTHPESLVYQVDDDGGRTLVAAMYLLAPGSRLATVPDLGGSLTPWHTHENICVSAGSGPPTAGGVADAAGACPPGQEPFSPVPMLHVWVTPHPCGPFASLESVAGLEADEDEIVFCDHVHGA